MRRLVRFLASGVAVVLLTLVLLEAGFRVAGVALRSEPLPAPDGSRVALCVGDSHTQGRVAPDNYPTQLERLLNERTGERWRVVNVGLAGQNTAQIRSRFERYLAYYRPTVVVHWAGINNSWNHAERQETSGGLGAWLRDHSRVVRLVRATLYFRRLWRDTAESPSAVRDPRGPVAGPRVNFGGREENIRSERGDNYPDADIERFTTTDLTAMARIARQRGVPLVLVTYAFREPSPWTPVDRGIRAVASAEGLPLVDSLAAVEGGRAEAPGADLFDQTIHPTPLLYRHVAEAVYRALVAAGIVPAQSPAPSSQPRVSRTR